MRCALLLILMFSASADALSVPDQVHLLFSNNSAIIGGYPPAIQTFTVGVQGQLTFVEVDLQRLDSPVGAITIEIRSTVGGVPTDQVLASATIQAASIPSTHSYNFLNLIEADLRTAGLFVSPGEILAIGVGGSFSTYKWFSSDAPGYSGGSRYSASSAGPPVQWLLNPDDDYIFRTFVDPGASVPEPSECLLLATGLALLGGTRRVGQGR